MERAPAPGFTACLGPVDRAGRFDMYVIGEIGDAEYTGVIRCQIIPADRPAPNSILLSCQGEMADLPAAFAGGFLTSNTLSPRCDGTNVPGYTSSSIVSIRLWRASASTPATASSLSD